MNRAVFLDRDGVINRAVVRNGKPYPPPSLEDFEILPGVEQALVRLRKAGFILIVVTNQPDVARGTQQLSMVEAMHNHMRGVLPIDDIKVCYQEDGPDSDCYKPKPGMLLEAAREHDLDLARSYMVGDRWRDVGCGLAAGCYTIFIESGYEETLTADPHATCGNLPEAVDLILQHAQNQYPERAAR